MNKLHYIPNCWHEQIANLYNLELVSEDADILILRDPFDRAIEQTMDFLDSGGDPKGKTFEEIVFEKTNVYTKSLKIETNQEKNFMIKVLSLLASLIILHGILLKGHFFQKNKLWNMKILL